MCSTSDLKEISVGTPIDQKVMTLKGYTCSLGATDQTDRLFDFSFDFRHVRKTLQVWRYRKAIPVLVVSVRIL